jgi:hypothetical protein
MSRIGTALIAAFISMTLFGCAPSQQATQSESLSREMAEFPKMKVGDKWTFIYRPSPRTKAGYPRKGYEEVVDVHPDGSWEEIQFFDDDQEKTRYYWNNMFQVIKGIKISTNEEVKFYRGPDSVLNFPLAIGKKWSDRKLGKSTNEMTYRYRFEYEVKSFERIKVKAGTFLAFKIELNYQNVDEKVLGARWTRLFWYAPEVKKIIKYEPENTEEVESMEMIDYSPAK